MDRRNKTLGMEEQVFKLLTEQLNRMETKIDEQNDKISSIEGKIKYVYGFAAGIGIFMSIIIAWVKDKIDFT